MIVIAYLGRHPDRPERWALMRPDGSVSNWFARDETRREIADLLAQVGMTLRNDGSVVCVGPIDVP